MIKKLYDKIMTIQIVKNMSKKYFLTIYSYSKLFLKIPIGFEIIESLAFNGLVGIL